MVQRVEAWGNVLEFPDGMSDDEMASAIRENEAHLNPNASTLTKASATVSKGIDAGLSLLTPKKSIADRAQEQSASLADTAAPQVSGVPIRRDYYAKVVAETPQGSTVPDTGIVSRVRNVAANDKQAQLGKKVVGKALVSTEPVPEEGGFINSAGRTIGQNIKGAGQIAADFIPGVGQDNAVRRYGQAVIDANPTAVNSLEDIAAKPGTAFTEATGNAAPSMAGMVGARAVGQGITALAPFTGPAAPLVAAAGQVVSWLGPAAIASLPSYGGIRDKQILNDPKNEKDAKAIAIATMGAAAVGAIEQAFGPQQWAMAALTKEGRAQLAEKFAATTLPGAMLKGATKGAAVEGAEELAQNPIEQLASFDNPTTKENIKDTLFGGAMGAIGGFGMGAGVPVIAGKPVTEVSDQVLRYTAARGGERAKAAAQAELDRRSVQGVDPEIANAPESTSEAVDRIIATGRDKADEIRSARAVAPDALQSNVLDEEANHIGDANNMVENAPSASPQTTQDAPTPEPIQTLNAQLNALAEDRKPGVLLTPGEPMPDALPEGVKAAEVPGRGTLLYRDDATLQAALNGQMGQALGYGIDEKPAGADQVVTARDANGTVIQDVATDGRPEVEQAAAAVAGPNGTVETRPVQEAMGERASNSPEFEGIKTQPDVVIPTSKENQNVAAENKSNLVELPQIKEAVSATEIRPAQQPSSREAGNDSVANEAQAVHPLRPLVESLIKRRAAAKQGGKDLSNAIARAKEVMDGKRTDKTVENRWFRLQAKAFEKADQETATILRRIADTVNQVKGDAHESGQTKTGTASKERDSSGHEVAHEGRDRGSKKEGQGSVRVLSKSVRGNQSSDEVLKDGSPKFSRSPSKQDVAFAHDFLVELSDVDEMFRYKVSHKTSLKGVMEEVYPGAEYVGDGTREDERDESGADHRYVFKSPHGKQFYVYERDNGEVFIDVSNFSKGEGGQAVYAAVANWAYNTKRKFIGDPAGLTADSLIRRTSNMLSSAIRFGTVKHLEAAPQQIAGDPKNGVPPLDWSGNDVEKIRALIHTFVTTLDNKFPQLKGYRYDFASRQFVDRRGRPVGPDRFTYAEATGMGSAARAGKATMRRGILIQSLVSSSGSERPGILEQVLRGSRAFVLRGKLEGIFSRKAETERISAIRQRLKAAAFKKKQATHSGGLSVSQVERLIAPIQRAGVKKINIAATQRDLPQDIQSQIKSEGRGGVRGVYIPETDEIWLVADQLHDADEVGLVASHEARHRGLRKLFGPDIDPLMRQIYLTNKSVRDKADRMMKQVKGMSKEDAVEEVLADLSIDGVKNLNGWKKLVRFIKQWFADKFNLTFTDEMVEQLVVGAEIAGFKDGEVSLFDDQQAGAYEKASEGALFSRSPSSTFDSPDPSRLDSIIHSLQDKNIDLKRVTEAIKATGKQIADHVNAYLQEELFHGRSATRVKEFIDNELNPLITLLRVNGIKLADFEEYLWARHAEERNEQIAKINPDMPDGGSGMSTKDARNYLAGLDADKKKLYEALAKRVDAITKKSRQVLVDYGLESQKTVDAWEGAYQHYVPLMREDMDHAFGNGTGQGFSVKGNASKRATGSKRPVVDILANIAQQREKYIIRGEKNRVATALVGLAKENPNPDFWKVDVPPTIRTVEPGKTVYQVLYHGSVVQEFASRSAAQKLIDFEGNPGYSIKEDKQPERVVDRVDPNYKSRDNVIVARIPDSKGNIQERSVVFNEHDERALRMAQSLKNLDQDQLNWVLDKMSIITRYFSAINTQYNPIFGIVNLTRDVQGAALNLTSTPLAGKKKTVLSRTGPALLAIYQSMRGGRKGKAVNNQWSALWEEFQKEGGKTGFRDMYKNARDRAEALEKGLNPDWWQTTRIGKVITAGGLLNGPEKVIADKAVRPLFEWLSDYNDAMENAVRLAAYKTGLEQGLSKQQAASVAKNLTVNFNKRGAAGRQLGALYAFFNASVQGSARLIETMKGPAGKRIVAGGIILGGMQAMLLAMAGMGDDEPPEFVKSKNLIIPIGDGKYISIPMPLGFNVLPNLGRISTEFALSGFKDPGKRTVQMMDSVLDAFNPVGNAGMSLQTIAFTPIDPLAALAENKDWTGKPIARQDFNAMNPTPGFTRAKDTASVFSKLLAEGINYLSGGTKYQPGKLSPTPDQIDYLISQATGGVGREYLKAEQGITSLFTGEELPAHKRILIGRFYGDTKGQSSQGAEFYDNLKRINGHEAEIKGRMKNREDVAEYKRENPEWELIGAANAAEKRVQELRKRKRDLVEKGAEKESVKLIDELITATMKSLNEKVRKKTSSIIH